MAKQKGIIKLEGTIGDITFHKSKDGYIAKEKSSVPAERIANDPAFQRTRENGAEFGRAGKASKLLRNSLRALLQRAADSRVTSRLVKEMMRVIHADLTSIRGQRNVIDGESELLKDFDFNVNSKLATTLFAPYTANIDRVTGECSVNIPSYVPVNMIAAPGGATHYRIFAGASVVDFQGESFSNDVEESAVLPLTNVASVALNLVCTLAANSTHPIFLALGIEFLQEVNGTMYALHNGTFNALSLVQVNGG